MTKHLFGIICTHHGTAANNRAETEGNITTLQKILWNGAVHSTVSAEAIRWSLRYGWQRKGLTTNRQWQDELNRHEWADPDFRRGAAEFIDDDVLGYMSARAAQAEANSAETERGGRQGRARGTTDARRARLEVTRAISLTPWAGDITFNAASINATPSAALQGMFPVPYGTEVHATRYQYGFALTPTELAVPQRALEVVDGLMQLGQVAGNHARFLFDFSPDSVIFRWTDDFAPRMLYAFREENGAVRAPMVVERVRAGDIRADELIVGGAISTTADGQTLRELGATVHAGVLAAAEDIKQRLAAFLNTLGGR